MRSKTLALLLVAVIASGIVFAVSAQSQITAADIAKAILPGGFINPKAIMPGAITTEHLADSAVTSAKIADGTIATGDIADDAVTSAKIADNTVAETNLASGAIPHITHFKAGITSLDATEKEVLNTTADGVTLTTTATRDFIIIYSVNVSKIGGTAPGWVNISKVDIIDNNGAFVKRATPQEVRIADDSDYGTVVSATFYADDVSAGARGVNVTVTTDETGGELHNQTIVVIAL